MFAGCPRCIISMRPFNIPTSTSGNHFPSVRLIIEEQSQLHRRSIYRTGGSMVVKMEIRSPLSTLHLTHGQCTDSISVEISNLFTHLCSQTVSLLIFAVEQSLSVSSSQDIYLVWTEGLRTQSWFIPSSESSNAFQPSMSPRQCRLLQYKGFTQRVDGIEGCIHGLIASRTYTSEYNRRTIDNLSALFTKRQWLLPTRVHHIRTTTTLPLNQAASPLR